MSQHDLGQRVGLREPHVSRLERSGRLCRLDLLLIVARALGVPVTRLLPPESTDDP